MKENSNTSKNLKMIIPNHDFRGKCRELTGQAKQFPSLEKRVMNHAWSFLEPLEFSGRAYKNLYKFEQKFMHAFKIESWKESNKKESCLKEVTEEKIQAILAIGIDDRGPGWRETERFEYAEHTLENLLHLVFDMKCKIRRKLHYRINKAFKSMEDTCRRWCSAYGFDYFFFSSRQFDYFQAYYGGRHEDKVEVLGEEFYYWFW